MRLVTDTFEFGPFREPVGQRLIFSEAEMAILSKAAAIAERARETLPKDPDGDALDTDTDITLAEVEHGCRDMIAGFHIYA